MQRVRSLWHRTRSTSMFQHVTVRKGLSYEVRVGGGRPRSRLAARWVVVVSKGFGLDGAPYPSNFARGSPERSKSRRAVTDILLGLPCVRVLRAGHVRTRDFPLRGGLEPLLGPDALRRRNNTQPSSTSSSVSKAQAHHAASTSTTPPSASAADRPVQQVTSRGSCPRR
jgi:hypothetical protein